MQKRYSNFPPSEGVLPSLGDFPSLDGLLGDLPSPEGLVGNGEGWLGRVGTGEGGTSECWAASISGQTKRTPVGVLTAAALAQESRDKREVIRTAEKIMLEGVEGRGSEEVRSC